MRFNMLNTPETAKRIGRRMLQSLQGQYALCACMAFYWAWQIVFLQSPASLSSNLANKDILMPQGSLLLLSSASTYAVLWLFHIKAAPLARRPLYLIVITSFICLGSIATSLPLSSLDGHSGLETAGAIAMGIGAAAFVVELGRIFAKLGPLSALTCGTIGIFGGSIMHMLLVAAFSTFAPGILCLFPAAAVVCYARASAPFPLTSYRSHGLDQSMSFPSRYAATCFIQGLALGNIATILSIQGSTLADHTPYFLAFTAGGLLVLLSSFVLNLDFNQLVYQIGFTLMALSFVLCACLPETPAASGFTMSVGHCFMYIVITCINSYFSNRMGCSPVWIVSLSTFFLVLGQVAGNLLVSILGGSTFGVSVQSLATIFSFALPASAIFLLNNRSPLSGWGAVQPGEEHGLGSQSPVARLAKKYRLTPRETDVAELLFRGRNKKRISEDLGLAEETIKSHMANIYRKPLVHSQQELIDLVEEEQDQQQDTL